GLALGAVVRNVGGTRARPDEAIEWCVANAKLRVRDGSWVAINRRALHEQEIAEILAAANTDHEWPAVDDIAKFAPDGKPLSEHQLANINAALTARICCLQGSPGVGKTFAVACIVKALIDRFG